MALLGAAINLAIDPFNRFGMNKLGVLSSNERVSKKAQLRLVSHDALLMGSSMVAYIDPAPLPCHVFYNAAFASALPEEILNFLQEEQLEPKLILLGLDPYMMNERSYPLAARHYERLDDWTESAAYLFSLNVLKNAFMAVGADYVRSGLLEPRGNRNAAQLLKRNSEMATHNYENAIRALIESDYRGFRYSDARLGVIKEIRDMALRRNIRLKVFLNPMNEDLHQSLSRIGMEATIRRFREDMRAILPDLADFTDSSFARRDNYFRFDPYHYLPIAGDAMMRSLLIEKQQSDGDSLNPVCRP